MNVNVVCHVQMQQSSCHWCVVTLLALPLNLMAELCEIWWKNATHTLKIHIILLYGGGQMCCSDEVNPCQRKEVWPHFNSGWWTGRCYIITICAVNCVTVFNFITIFFPISLWCTLNWAVDIFMYFISIIYFNIVPVSFFLSFFYI